MLSNICAAARLLFDCTGQMETLTGAVEVGRAAVAATSPDDPDRGARSANLAALLWLPERAGQASVATARREIPNASSGR